MTITSGSIIQHQTLCGKKRIEIRKKMLKKTGGSLGGKKKTERLKKKHFQSAGRRAISGRR